MIFWILFVIICTVSIIFQVIEDALVSVYPIIGLIILVIGLAIIFILKEQNIL